MDGLFVALQETECMQVCCGLQGRFGLTTVVLPGLKEWYRQTITTCAMLTRLCLLDCHRSGCCHYHVFCGFCAFDESSRISFSSNNSTWCVLHAVIHKLCAVDTEMQLLYVLWCNNQLSVQPLFKEVPLSMCIWKWLFSGFSSLYLSS